MSNPERLPLVRVNNRRLLDALVLKSGIQDPIQARTLVSTIDKFEKIGKDAVLEEIKSQINTKAASLVNEYLSVNGNSQSKLQELHQLLKGEEAADEGIDNLEQVFKALEGSGISSEKVTFDQSIARGLNYYTGIIYETTLKQLPKIGSVCSGGRYDNLVKDLGGPDLPAVGTSVGVDRLFTALQQLGQLETAKTPSEVMIVNFSTSDAPIYMNTASQLRRDGIATEIYFDQDKMGKQFKAANKLGIPFIVMLGFEEQENNSAMVKNMEIGEQTLVQLNSLSSFIQGQKKKE